MTAQHLHEIRQRYEKVASAGLDFMGLLLQLATEDVPALLALVEQPAETDAHGFVTVWSYLAGGTVSVCPMCSSTTPPTHEPSCGIAGLDLGRIRSEHVELALIIDRLLAMNIAYRQRAEQAEAALTARS